MWTAIQLLTCLLFVVILAYSFICTTFKINNNNYYLFITELIMCRRRQGGLDHSILAQ